jgi:hypothetical protein
MDSLPDSFVRFAVLAIAAAVITSFYCGPAAIVAVIVALVVLWQYYGHLDL